jgi:hypothetical protein
VDSTNKEQKAICLKFGSSCVEAELNSKVGIALETIGDLPLNALRHPPEGDTCGWYIWGGETLSQDSDFFQPLHVSHLKEKCPEIIKYLALAPGWRVLLAGEQEDVWYDEGLLNVGA